MRLLVYACVLCVVQASTSISYLDSLPNEVFHAIRCHLDSFSANRLFQTSKSLQRKFHDPDSITIDLIKDKASRYISQLSHTDSVNVSRHVGLFLKAVEKEEFRHEWYRLLSKIHKRHWEKTLADSINDDKIILNPKTASAIFVVACYYGHSVVARLLSHYPKVDPAAFRFAIRYAAEMGHLKVLKILLKHKTLNFNDAIRAACRYGHLEILKLLLNDVRVDPSEIVDEAFREASKNGHLEIVKLLLNHHKVILSPISHYAITEAAKNKDCEIMNLIRNHQKTDTVKYHALSKMFK